jgi:hypothetical protein
MAESSAAMLMVIRQLRSTPLERARRLAFALGRCSGGRFASLFGHISARIETWKVDVNKGGHL